MIHIREADLKDMERLVLFFDTHLAGDWFMFKGKWLKILTGTDSRGGQHTPDVCAIAENDGGEIVGIAIMSRYTKKLFNLIVHSSYRKQGVGKALLDYLKPRHVRCKTDMSSGNPKEYYERLGYVHVGNYDLWGNRTLIGKNKNIAWMTRKDLL